MAGLVKREHVVAAGLVGTVVVVVGFASGLGIRQPTAVGATEAAPPAAQSPSSGDAPPQVSAGSTAGGASGSGYYPTGGGGGVDYVGTPIGGGAAPTSAPATDPPSTQPPTTTSPPTSPPTTGNPVPGCQEGLVPAVLDTVTSTVVAVPVAGPALGTLGINDLGSGLLNGVAGLGLLPPATASSTTDSPLAGIVDPLVVTCVAPAEIPASASTVVLGAGS